jgi:hypothetical protein
LCVIHPDYGGRASLQSIEFLLHFHVADHQKDSTYVSIMMRVTLTELLSHWSKDFDCYMARKQLVYQEMQKDTVIYKLPSHNYLRSHILDCWGWQSGTLLLMRGIQNVTMLRGVITERCVYFQNMNPFYVTNIYINFQVLFI